MPDIMQAQFVRICSLSAMITKVANELLITIFTNNCMVLVGHLCLFAIVAANAELLTAVAALAAHKLILVLISTICSSVSFMFVSRCCGKQLLAAYAGSDRIIFL